MDERLRTAKLAWEQRPGDPEAWAAYRHALHRAGQPWQVAGCAQAGDHRLRDVAGYRAPTEVQRVAWSADGRWALTYPTLELWDAPAQRRIWTQARPEDEDMEVAVSPSGARLAVLGEERLRVIARDGTLLLESAPSPWEAERWVRLDVDFLDEDRLLISMDDCGVTSLLSISQGGIVRTYGHGSNTSDPHDPDVEREQGPRCRALAPDHTLWAWARDKDHSLWWSSGPNTRHGPVWLRPEAHAPIALAFSPDASVLAVLYDDWVLLRLHLATLRPLDQRQLEVDPEPRLVWYGAELVHGDGVLWCAHGPTAQVFAVALDGPTLPWRLPAETWVGLPPSGDGAWTALGWLRLHDARLVLHPHDGHAAPVASVTVQPSGSWASLAALGPPRRSDHPTPTPEPTSYDAQRRASDRPHEPMLATSPSGVYTGRAVRGVLEVYREGVLHGRSERTPHPDDELGALALRDDGLAARLHRIWSELTLTRSADGAPLARYVEEDGYLGERLAFSVEGDALVSVGWEVSFGWEVSPSGDRLELLWRTPNDLSAGELHPSAVATSSAARVWAVAVHDRLLLTSWGSNWPRWEQPLAHAPRSLDVEDDGARLRLVDTHGIRWFAAQDGTLLDQLEVDLSTAGDTVESAARSGDVLVVGTRQGAVLRFTRPSR